MIKLKSILKEVFGKRVTIKSYWTTFPALISQNTRAIKGGEEPYRLTWFMSDPEGMLPAGHVDMNRSDVEYLLKNKNFSPTTYDKMRDWLDRPTIEFP